MWQRWAGVVVLVLSLGACSGDDDEGSDDGDQATTDEAVERVATEFAGYDDPNGLRFNEDEAQCAAEALVQAFGADRVVELGAEGGDGFTEEALDADEQDAMFEAMTGCIDLEGQMKDLLVEGGLSEEAAECVSERYLDTDLPKRSMMSDYDPELNEELDAALTEAYEACGGV